MITLLAYGMLVVFMAAIMTGRLSALVALIICLLYTSDAADD